MSDDCAAEHWRQRAEEAEARVKELEQELDGWKALGRQDLLVEVMACDNPASKCRGPAVAINGTVIIGSCGGPYRVVARGCEQARYLLALRPAPEGGRP